MIRVSESLCVYSVVGFEATLETLGSAELSYYSSVFHTGSSRECRLPPYFQLQINMLVLINITFDGLGPVHPRDHLYLLIFEISWQAPFLLIGR